MGTKLRWVSIVITALLTYLFASAPDKKLLLFENIFTDDVHAFIFDNSRIILFVLIIIYITAEIFAHFRSRNKTLESQCHNICRYIYKYIDKKIGQDFAHNIRITIFKVKRPNTEKVYIKAVNRYQTKEPFKKTKIKFYPGEGVAGCCFQTQTLVYASLPEYSEKNRDIYYKESWNNYKLDDKKIDKLNSKSCLFLGIPIKCFDTEKTWGVLVLDSTKKHDKVTMEFAREIEAIISHYTAFFREEDKG